MGTSPFGWQDSYPATPLASGIGTMRDEVDGTMFVTNQGYFTWQPMVNNGPRCKITTVSMSISDMGAGNWSWMRMFIYEANGVKSRASNLRNPTFNGSGAVDIPGVAGDADVYTFTFTEFIWDTDELIYLVYCSPSTYYYGSGYRAATPTLKQDDWDYVSYPTSPGFGRYPFHFRFFYGAPACDDPYGGFVVPTDYTATWFFDSGPSCTYVINGVPSSWLTFPPDLDDLPDACVTDATGDDVMFHIWFDAETYGPDKVEPGGVPLTVSGIDEFPINIYPTYTGIDITETYKFADIRVHPYYTEDGDPGLDYEYPWHPNIIQPWGQWL